MKLFEIIKYRWKYDSNPLPGELWPTKDGVRIIAYTQPEECEPQIILRKLRAVVLGYGQSWTFVDALKDTLWPF